MQIGGSRNQLQRCYHVRWFAMEMRNASAIKRRASWWNRFARHEEEVNASQAISLVDCIIEARKIDELSVSYGNCRSKWCRGGSALNRLIGFVACVIQRLTIDMVITCNCAGTRVKDERKNLCVNHLVWTMLQFTQYRNSACDSVIGERRSPNKANSNSSSVIYGEIEQRPNARDDFPRGFHT